MLKFLLLVVFFCVCLIGLAHYITMERNKKTLLTSSEKIPLQTVMAFSIFELTDKLKEYYGKKGTVVLIEYADDKYIELDTSDTQSNLFNKLSDIQDLMISKRYNPDKNYVVKDYIDKIMYEIWLDYAYKVNYRNLFWKEMSIILEEGKISESSYNKIYETFYKYKFLKNK